MARAKSNRGGSRSEGVKGTTRKVQIVVKADQAREVVVVGDFNKWEERGIPLRKSSDGRWQTTLTLEPGEYQYRLKVDGQWQDHPEAEKRVPNPFGSENCVLVVR